MYLYLDLILLLNFLIDYLLLWMTALFRKIEMNKWRVALAALVGSLYILFLFLPALQSYYTFLIKVGMSLLLIMIAFGFGNLARFMKSFLMFYFVSFITGGGLLGVHFMLQNEHQIMQGILTTQSSGYGDPISWLFIVIGFPLLYWFSKKRWQEVEATKVKAHAVVEVTLLLRGQKISCQGLIDTGNQLHEPLSKYPVMMLEAAMLKESIPEKMYQMIMNEDEYSLISAKQGLVDDEWLSRVRYIPYRGVRQGMQIMLAVRPDYVMIRYENKIYQTANVYVGLNKDSLSGDGLFQAIVHPALIQNQQKEEAI